MQYLLKDGRRPTQQLHASRANAQPAGDCVRHERGPRHDDGEVRSRDPRHVPAVRRAKQETEEQPDGSRHGNDASGSTGQTGGRGERNLQRGRETFGVVVRLALSFLLE